MRVKDMNRRFRFFTIKYWKDYIRLIHILKCIKNAKLNFLVDRSTSNNKLHGLCYYLGEELFDNHLFSYYDIKYIIPVFTPQFFNSNKYEGDYWWDIYDVHSRIDAFNKLINHYENLIKEL